MATPGGRSQAREIANRRRFVPPPVPTPQPQVQQITPTQQKVSVFQQSQPPATSTRGAAPRVQQTNFGFSLPSPQQVQQQQFRPLSPTAEPTGRFARPRQPIIQPTPLPQFTPTTTPQRQTFNPPPEVTPWLRDAEFQQWWQSGDRTGIVPSVVTRDPNTITDWTFNNSDTFNQMSRIYRAWRDQTGGGLPRGVAQTPANTGNRVGNNPGFSGFGGFGSEFTPDQFPQPTFENIIDPNSFDVLGGNDPLSADINNAIQLLLRNQGQTDFGKTISEALKAIIDNQGEVGDTTDLEFERARELTDKARRAQLNQARSELAGRGLLSEPGIQQGPLAGTIGRVEQNIAPEFAAAVRDIFIDNARRKEDRLFGALQMATGLSQDQARVLLSTAQTGTQRQQVLSNIALDVLRENISFNQFLAEFGLQRELVMHQIQQGNMSNILPLLNMFLQQAGQSARGFV